MGIEGEGRPEARPPHDLEAHAIDEAQGGAARRQENSHPGLVDLPRHPDKTQDRPDILLEDANGFHPDTPRQDGRGLHENIIVRDEGMGRTQQLFPGPLVKPSMLQLMTFPDMIRISPLSPPSILETPTTVFSPDFMLKLV